jgi:hypothetical protein
MAIKYINIVQSKVLQNLPKLGFWVLNQTIWERWWLNESWILQNCICSRSPIVQNLILWNVEMLHSIQYVGTYVQRSCYSIKAKVAINHFHLGGGGGGWWVHSMVELRSTKRMELSFFRHTRKQEKICPLRIAFSPNVCMYISSRLVACIHIWKYRLWKHMSASLLCCADQGCQMVCFQTKNPSVGKFWRALDWKMLIYILWPFGILYGYFWYYMTIWYILYSFGTFFRFWYHVPKKNLATLVLTC